MQSVRKRRNGAGPRKQVIIRAADAAAAIVLAAPATRAADVHWNSADGNWNIAENWLAIDPNPPAVPGPADRAILDLLTGGTARVTTDLADDVLSIQVQNGNVLSVEAGGIVGTGATGVAATDTIRIGDASTGSAVVLDGGTLRNNTLSGLGADIYVGVLAGGVGTFSQSGATSVVFARDMRMGSDTGTGSYTFTGGSLQTNWTIVGRVGGTGTLTVDGGTILAKNSAGEELRVADGAASTGTVNLLSGTIDTTGQVNVGFGSGSGANLGNGTGTMTHTGGLLTTINTMAVARRQQHRRKPRLRHLRPRRRRQQHRVDRRELYSRRPARTSHQRPLRHWHERRQGRHDDERRDNHDRRWPLRRLQQCRQRQQPLRRQPRPSRRHGHRRRYVSRRIRSCHRLDDHGRRNDHRHGHERRRV